MISIIYAYRNRELQRIKASLDSLVYQTNKDFEVIFVDYGSEETQANKVQELLSSYSFVKYYKHPTQFQPWNKSKALNSVIRKLTTDFCFVSDIDMLFHPQFIERLQQLKNLQKATYFQVGFLSSKETDKSKKFNEYQIYFKSKEGATGMTLFPVQQLKKIQGFDEFYHFWGSEDTDIHHRLRNFGLEVNFYNKEILLLHQWHPSYRTKESSQLTKELQLSGIVQLNYQHCIAALSEKKTIVNTKNWGGIISLEQLEKLNQVDKSFLILNKKKDIDHFLYVQLPQLKSGLYEFYFSKDPFQNTLKYQMKKRIGKNVPIYYSLKEINDKLLLHIISFYRDEVYTYKITHDLQQIIFKIVKR